MVRDSSRRVIIDEDLIGSLFVFEVLVLFNEGILFNKNEDKEISIKTEKHNVTQQQHHQVVQSDRVLRSRKNTLTDTTNTKKDNNEQQVQKNTFLQTILNNFK